MKILIALAAGIIIGAAAMALLPGEGHQVASHTMNMADDMAAMTEGLRGKTGDAFDEAFLSEMIVHHQGAVEMAQAALQDAKHQEIKDLAKNIITAQNSEIKQMQDWQSSWYSRP